MTRGSVLHCGCGGDPLPSWLDYTETRLDIDPGANPHIVADMRRLPDIGPFDAIYCSHALEHVMPHEVVPTLSGFHRVLNPGGVVITFVPDLEDVRATDEVLFEAPAGPITGLDLIYGYRPMLEEKPYMAHRTGFTSATLSRAFCDAGFADVRTQRLSHYALIGIAKK